MFASPLDVRADGPGVWVLLAPLSYDITPALRLIVPAGFSTDLASIPRVIQLLPSFAVNGKSRAAAVLHDFLYSRRGAAALRLSKRILRVVYTRKECDELFREALVRSGVNRAAATLMYLGVRAGGWAAW